MSAPTPDGAEAADSGRAESFRSNLGRLFLLTLLFYMNFMARIVQAPLMPAIENDLNITHAEAGSLFLILSIGYFITLIGSGFVSARLTHRWTMVLSIGCAGGTLLATAASEGVWGIRFGLFLTGLSTGLYLPSAIAAITEFVSPRHWGKAIAIHEVAPNLAFVTAPVFAEAVLGWYSWQAVLAVLGVAALLSGIIFALFGRTGASAGEAPNLRSIGVLGRQPSYWLMILLFGLGISGSLGIYTMLPLFMVNAHGLERDFANTLLAVSRVPGVRQRLVHRPVRTQADHPGGAAAQRPVDHGARMGINGLAALPGVSAAGAGGLFFSGGVCGDRPGRTARRAEHRRVHGHPFCFYPRCRRSSGADRVGEPPAFLLRRVPNGRRPDLGRCPDVAFSGCQPPPVRWRIPGGGGG